MTSTNATIQEENLTPQQRANRRQNELRKGSPRLPSVYLSPEEAKLVNTLGKLAGNKRTAIFAGFDLLVKEYQKQGKLDAKGHLVKN